MPQRIPLRAKDGSIRAYAIVDQEDFDRIGHLRWCKHPVDDYAMRTYVIDGEYITRKLHRVLLDAPARFEVDHINGDRLDNRRSNLRLVTHEQNQHNRHKIRGSSQYRGVSLNKRLGRWGAYVARKGAMTFLGLYDHEDDAAAVAAAARLLVLSHTNDPRQPEWAVRIAVERLQRGGYDHLNPEAAIDVARARSWET